MKNMGKPLPKINGDNRFFWEGCKQHELIFQQCSECGQTRWPPSLLCNSCHSQKTQWIISRGIGKVFTFAVYHTAFHPAFASDIPYVVAVVALDEGPHLLSNIVECRPEIVHCDMQVTVVWENVSEEITLPKFRPVEL
jgi:uncharacterized protein